MHANKRDLDGRTRHSVRSPNCNAVTESETRRLIGAVKLSEPEGRQGRLVESRSGDEAMVPLEIREGRPGEGAHQAVDFAAVIALFLQAGLDVCHHLVERPD